MKEAEYSIEVQLLNFAENTSEHGESAKLRVWILQSLQHLVVGAKQGRERLLLTFRTADDEPSRYTSSGLRIDRPAREPCTYMAAVQDMACLFQDQGDGTIITKRLIPDAAIEYEIVEEPLWGLLFALPRSCFQPFSKAVAAMGEILAAGKIAGAEVFKQDVS